MKKRSSLYVPSGPEEDWEKARAWLAHEKVTKMSAKVPGLTDISDEMGLYNYLKDGTELCRVIGLVTRGQVLQGITYRTGNISTLEENNISLFLNYVETETDLGIKDIFGRKREKVFSRFSDFHIVLSALSQISKKLEVKLGVAKFDVAPKKRESRPSVDEGAFIAIYESQSESSYENEIYGAIYDIVPVKAEGSALDHAIDEMIHFNETFITKVLEHIKMNFEEKTQSQLLKKEFFPIFHTDDLLKLHLKLRHHFEKLKYSYVEVGEVFDNLKDDFLVYCKILARMKTAMEFFADQMTQNEEEATHIRRLQKEASKSELVQKDPRVTCQLRDLMAMVPQHVMRYHMILEEVRKQASKAGKPEVAKEAERARQIMLNLTQHIEKVSNDYKYIQAMKEFRKEIRNLSIDNLHIFGVLQSEKQDVLLSLGEGNLSFQHFHLLVFSEHIVALEKRTKEEFTGKKDFFGRPIRNKKEVKCFSKCFQLTLVDSIIKKPIDEKSFHLWVNSYTDTCLNPEKTFVLSFKSAEVATETEKELKKTVAKCRKELKLRKSHEGHKFKKLRGEGSLTTSSRTRCAQCQKLLLGLLHSGVECLTCKEIYHTECISEEADNLPSRQEYFDGPSNLNIVKPEDLTLEDISLGDASRQEAALHLKGTKPGTFLLRHSQAHDNTMLAVKTFEEEVSKKICHIQIHKVKVHEEDFFYLERGVCARSILELISLHRASHKLYIPIFAQDEDITIVEYEREKESLRACNSTQEFPIQANLGEGDDDEAGSLPFFHGDMKSVEASEKLKNEPEGSFLLRRTEEGLKLSWKRLNGKMLHAGVKKEGNRYSLVSKKTFSTIQELTRFYQNVERDHKLALGQPLLNDRSFIQKPVSETDQLAQLSFYQGVMSEPEIAVTLQWQPDHVFLLATDPDLDETFICYRKNHRTLHLKIEQDSKNSFGVETWEMGRMTASSISGLVRCLQAERILSKPFAQSNSKRKNDIWKTKMRGVNMLSRGKTPSGAGTEYDTDDSEVSRVTKDSRRRRSLLKRVESEENYENISSLVQESRNVPSLKVLGSMTKRDAERALFSQPEGTWLLRYNNLHQETISVKTPEKVVHMKLYHSEGGVALHEHKRPKPLHSLVKELQEGGKLGQQLEEEKN